MWDDFDYGAMDKTVESEQERQEWFRQLRKQAHRKFFVPSVKRLVKETVVLLGKLVFCWLIVLIWMYLGLTYFFMKFNAIDHLAGLQYTDWAEMALVATAILWAMFRLFGLVVKDEKR